MIPEAVKQWENNKHSIEEAFSANPPEGYSDLVRAVISNICGDEDSDLPLDPERIHSINDGEYQGTLVFVIAAKGYSPEDYWYVKVSYGSCSGCDTLQHINSCFQYDDETGNIQQPPTAEQIKDYMTLALHIVQGLNKMADTE